MSMYMKRLFVCVLVYSALAAGASQRAKWQQWFLRANEFYSTHEYDSAARYYKKVLDAGGTHSAVFYNLGNCYYRTDSLGLAILYYEKAHARNPGGKDVEANLHIARQRIVNKTPQQEYGFVEAVIHAFHTFFTLRTQLWILFILLGSMALLFAVALFSSYAARVWCMYAGIVTGVFFVAVGSSASRKIYVAETVTRAIVLDNVVDVRNEPKGDRVLFTIHEGIKLRCVKERREWVLITLPNGMSGWVPRHSLGVI